MMTHKSHEAGFSLLEVMIALVIFSIGIIALYAMQTNTITQNTSSRWISTSSSWAAEKLEMLMSLPDRDIVDANQDGRAGLGNNTPQTSDGSVVSPDGLYTIMWNVAEDDPLYRTKTIRAVVMALNGAAPLVELEYIKQNTM